MNTPLALSLGAALGIASLASAQQLITFQNNTVANADEVNANFTLVNDAAQAARTSVDGLNASLSPILGALTIASNRVGLGTTPGERLDVAGNIRIRTNDRLLFAAEGANTDTVFFTRQDVASNRTRLRLILGDDPQTGGAVDDFVIGTRSGTTDTTRFEFRTDGTLRLLSDGGRGSRARILMGDEGCSGCISIQEISDDRLRINAGQLGIRRDPSGNSFEVEGSASKSSAGNWLANSDERIKRDVHTIDSALDTLDRVRLVRFHYDRAYLHQHPSIDDREYFNVIAQEFAEVFPSHVQGSGEKLPDGDEILQVDTYPLTIFAAAATQELHAKVKDQQQEIDALRLANEALAARLATVESLADELAALKASMAALAAGR